MLKTIVIRRNSIYLAIALISAAIGYAAAIVHVQRMEATEAVADLWFFHEVLVSLEGPDPDSGRAAIAHKADLALETIAEGRYIWLTRDQEEFRSRVLQEYRAFREARPHLYAFSSNMKPDLRDEWMRRNQRLSDFLKQEDLGKWGQLSLTPFAICALYRTQRGAGA